LSELLREMQTGEPRKAQARVARLAASRVGHERRKAEHSLKPITISIDNESSAEMTVLHVQSEDTPGFLYELSNALMLSGVNIRRMQIGSTERFVRDTLFVTDLSGRKLLEEDRLKELTTTILLVKHCMHLLPTAPDPESAWLHLREFLERMLSTPGWFESIGDLDEPRFLQSLTQILGVSDYLWEDFLRLHHDRVLPFVQNDAYLSEAKSVETLERDLRQLLSQAGDFEEKKQVLNRFKDRETFRTDVRHLLGYLTDFSQFSLELSQICDVVIEAGLSIARIHLEQTFGYPIDQDSGHPCRFCAMALGKCGGKELGFASDIELLFLYEGRGMTDGPKPIREQFFFERQIALLGELIVARREGIFELDLRLRPYGTAGPLAVSVESFRKYYEPDGPAWPYERQALVKLRPLAGDSSLATKALALRDEILYCGRPFDVAAMHGMREKQLLQHVEGGTIHAKLSPGALVEIEYLIQGLQIAWGRESASLRVPNTLTAIEKLKAAEVLSAEQAECLADAYRLLRELIDALRMVRGNARDLTLPTVDSEEFEFLARRTGFGENPEELLAQFERNSSQVLEVLRKLEERNAFQRPG
ncbi:MAG TPA: ACT domain-containing protein, partial [Planctomycetaceae bacterium]|nr:ACT domain-containing protein [Planctomycetaceae bacterium]